MPKEIIEYPKFLYHAGLGAKRIESAEDEELLGEGWVDSPAKFVKEPEKPKKVEAIQNITGTQDFTIPTKKRKPK